MTTPNIIVRPCFQNDLEVVQLIYAHHVLTGTGTFETEAPDLEEMTRRWSAVVTANGPFLVASPTRDLSRVLGFAYAKQFRDRQAYARTYEDSVYVAPTSQRQGVGKVLLAHLLHTLKEDGVREVIAVIGDSANSGSIAVHKALGFTTTGVLRNVGFKFDKWLDVVMMQRSLRKDD